MKRMYVAGLSWYLPNHPHLVLTNAEQTSVAAIHADAADFERMYQLSYSKGTRSEALTSVMMNLLIELEVSILGVQLISASPDADEALIHFAKSDGVLQRLNCTCLEAVGIAIAFDSPIYVSKTMISDNPLGAPTKLAQKESFSDSAEDSFADFIQDVSASDFASYVQNRNSQNRGNNSI